MKIKTFILTFLLMSCPFLFGQTNWWETNYDFAANENNCAIVAKFTQTNTIVGAFVGDELRGKGTTEADGYLYLTANVTVNDVITFKLSDGSKELSYYIAPITVTDNDKMGSQGNPIVVQACVAKIGENAYETLSSAIAAATAGQTIQLLANINENVTINKNLTIDGGEDTKYDFTGTMDSDNVNITVKNIDFIKGNIKTKKGKSNVNLTINNCTFDGQNSNAYAVNVNGISKIDIQNINAKGYLGFLQVATSGNAENNTIYMKDVIISEVSMGIKVDYASSVYLENVEMTAIKQAGILDSNFGIKTYTVKNCNIDASNATAAIGMWDRKTGIKDTFYFTGENTIKGDIQTDLIKLSIGPKGAKLTAKADLNITTDAQDCIVDYTDGVYSVVAPKAMIVDGDKYYTLTKAINAAKAGQTIQLLDNINENVTIKKNLTIDGGDDTKYDYTGTMTSNTGLTVTVKNVDFVNGGFTENLGTTGKYTINNCTFDGDNKAYGYAVTIAGAEKLEISNCTVKDYSYGFLYVSSSLANHSVKNVTVDNCNYGVRMVSTNITNLEEFIVTNTIWPVQIKANAARTVNMTNCSITKIKDHEQYPGNSLSTWGGTSKVTFNFYGNNVIENKIIDTEDDNFLLQLCGTTVEETTTYATLTAPQDLDVKTSVNRTVVVYENGVYELVDAAAEIVRGSDKLWYRTFDEAYKNVQADDELVLLQDVTISYILDVKANLTINGNGHTLTYTGYGASARAIDVKAETNGANLTVENLTIDCTASYCQRGINYNTNGKLTLDGVTVKGTNVTYALNLPGSSDNATVKINNSNLTANIALNVWGEKATIDAENSNFTSVDNSTAEGYAAIALNNDGSTVADGTIVNIVGGTITAKDEKGQLASAVRNATNTGNVIISDTTVVTGLYTKPVAIVTYGGDQFYSCATLQAAIDKAIETNAVSVKLIANVETTEIITVTAPVVIDGNGKTVTSKATRAFNIETTGKVVVNDLTVKAGERAFNIINEAATVELNKVTATANNNAVMIATSAGAVNLTINNSDLTGLAVVNVAGAGSQVDINNTKITNVDANEDENYGAITIWTSGKGALVTVDEKCTITVADDSKKGYVFPANAEIRGIDDIGYIVATVGDAGYDTLKEALEKVNAGETIEMVRNVTSSEILTINKAITINGNNVTLTSTATRAINIETEGEVIVNNLTIATTNNTERAINIIQKAADLTLNNVNAEGFKYTINVAASSNGSKIKTDGGKFSGYAAVNITGDNTVFTSSNTEFVGVNDAPTGNTNYYAAIVIGDYTSGNTTDNTVVTINGGKVTSTSSNGNDQNIVQVTATVNAKVTVNSELSLCNGNVFYTSCIDEVTAQFPAIVVEQLNAQGYATSDVVDGLVTVLEAVAIIDSKPYASLPAAFEAAKDGETVKLLTDIELATSGNNGAFVIEATNNRKLTLDLNDKNITAGARTGYTGRTQYAFDNYADLTITGKGTITSRGIQNYGTLTISSADVKVIACDTNGGACVWGYDGSITNISAGTFENNGTTTGMTSGIINTEGKLYVTGGTFTQSGMGATYAIICNDEATFANASITGIHGVISAINNANVTINSGTYTLVGVAGQSDHNVYANDNAKVTIKGGTFTCNEKDAGGKTLCLNSTTASFAVSGGSFDEDVEKYCADGFFAFGRANNIWTVEEATTQTLNLLNGWSWVSHNVIANEANDSEILAQMQEQLTTTGLVIKTQGQNTFVNNTEGVWAGGLKTTSVEKLYKVKTTAAETVKLTGAVVEDYNIVLVNGWNWIGYPLTTGQNLTGAFTPNNGDWIKGRNAFAEYYNGVWYGHLNSLEPGQGYMYYHSQDKSAELTYNTPSTRGAVEANITTDNNYWTVEASEYASNMSMVATLGADSENYELAAFVNGEVRGSARPIYVEAVDAYMFFLTINGDDVEEVTFKYYDIDTDTEYTLGERINYSNDAILGSIKEPVVLRGTLGMDEVSANAVAIYPNPTTTANEINLSTTCDKVEVFNALGVKVAEYQNVDTIDALETAGVYVIRVTNNGNTQNCRLVVK